MEIKQAILEKEKQRVKVFLDQFSLAYDLDIDHTIYIEDQEKIIGTISVANNIIKAFAVSTDYQGQNIASLLISRIINYLYQNHIYHYQVYTKPEYKSLFQQMNFKEIITSEKVCLLESINRSITDELMKLKQEYQVTSDDIGCLVMNCNPFTLGHLYLIKEASKRHKQIIVFILEEDKSFFSFSERLLLVKRGTETIKNVTVIPSTNYLVSSLTFPTYFLKQDVDTVYEQAICDALIFQKYFIPIFDIKKRYLGTETDKVTNKYNQALTSILKDKIEVIERMKFGEENISASIVRKLLETKDFEKLENYVPATTLNYLREHYE